MPTLEISKNRSNVMKVGIIGVGRMGKILASKLKMYFEVYVFDRDRSHAAKFAAQIGVKQTDSIEDFVGMDAVILAIPDREVLTCIKDFNRLRQKVNIINIATNVSYEVLKATKGKDTYCIGAKFISQADEMAKGEEPVIIIDRIPQNLAEKAYHIFSQIGHVIVGEADIVADINNIAANKILEAAVKIEAELNKQGYYDPMIVKAALNQVAAGVLKAYSQNNLGPFGREIVREVRRRLDISET